MKLSTLLLSSAALVVAGSAYAADLPAKKGAPAAKPAATGCPSFGAGFWQIPGGDTCLKISGYVRSNNTATLSSVARGTAPYSLGYDYFIGLDARNNSDVGVIRSYIEIDGGPADGYALVQAAGFTLGMYDNMTDIGWGGINSNWSANNTAKGIRYDAAVGSTTLSLAANQAATTSNGVTSGRPDLLLGIDTKAGPMQLTAIGVSHEAAGTSSGSANAYALISRAKVTMGAMSAQLNASYANGATTYLSSRAYSATGIDDTNSTSSTTASGSNFGGNLSATVGNGSLYVFGGAINITGATSTATYKETDVGVGYAATVAKGLTVTPEIYSASTNYSGIAATTNTLYVRIQRDF